MQKPAIPVNEPERLATLKKYEILDTLPEQEFDDLTLLASEVCGTPIALISLVDSDRQWFKSKVGIDASETARDISFCGHAVTNEALLIVPDATDDYRFEDNPLVVGDPQIRFYAGAPLISPENYILGTLCVIDQQKKVLTQSQIAALEALSRQVVSQMELRRKLIREKEISTKQRLFFDNSLDLLCLIGFDGYFKELNPLWSRIFGYSIETLMTNPVLDIIHPDDIAETQEMFKILMENNQDIIGFENRFLTQDGQCRWLSWRATIEVENNIIIATARDITEQQQIAAALEEARQQAEQANASKSAFLANMSHELRTPLNSVIGFTNLLLKNKNNNLLHKDINYLDRILANGKHLLELLNDILDLSKIEAERLELKVEEIQLSSLIKDIIRSLESNAQQRNVQLQMNVPQSLNSIIGDLQRTRQILINLVGNSLKFTENGIVEVRVICGEDTVTPVRIDVVDTGIGIPEDKLEVIFDAFRQADDSTSRIYGGTGLGLAISRSLCLAQAWNLEVTSVINVGSTFSIVLNDSAPPLVHIPPQGAAIATSILPSTLSWSNLGELRHWANDLVGANCTILVIDDDADARLLMEHYAEDFGCRVVAVDSGEQGIKLAKIIKPALITLDLCMPEVDGFEVLRALRDDPELRDIPVVVCSIIGEEKRASLLGSVKILDKPVDRQIFLQTIQEYIRTNIPTSGNTALIIDDDPDSQELLQQIMIDLDFQIDLATNGEEGLQQLQAHPPDLIVLDLMMPILDGFGFIEKLRQQDEYTNVPIIICTAKELTPQDHAILHPYININNVVTKGSNLDKTLRSVLNKVLSI